MRNHGFAILKKTRSLLIFLLFSYPFTGTAQETPAQEEKAEKIFSERASKSKEISEALTIFKSLASSEKDKKKLVHYIERFGGLSFYKGEYQLSKDQSREKAALYKECSKLADLLDPDLPGNPAMILAPYVYWKSFCTALWLDNADFTHRFRLAPMVQTLFAKWVNESLDLKSSKTINTKYMGGGIYRVLAKIYADPRSSILKEGLPNISKALVLIRDYAIPSESPSESGLSGMDFFINFRIEAEILIQTAKHSENPKLLKDAEKLLTEKISDIDNLEKEGRLPKGFEAETLGERKIMKRIQSEL